MNEAKPLTSALQGEVLPPAPQDPVRMPAGTLFGLGIFGAAKYAAIRRVLEEYERAARAQGSVYEAEGATAQAYARREVAREQLRHLPLIRADEANRIQHAYDARLRVNAALLQQADIDKLKRELEIIELEDRKAAALARREARAGQAAQSQDADAYTAFIDTLSRVPGVADAAAKAKADIVARAGGEEHLTDADRNMCDTIDAMAQGFAASRAEGAQ